MSKPVLGMLVGAILGLIDGLGAYAYPGVESMMTSIIVGSTFKGLLTGLATGFVAGRVRSLPLGIVAGLAFGFVLSLLVAATSPDPEGRYYYFEIILPGSLVGAIVGYACYRYGRAPRRSTT